ncbi:transglutaminase domain-containing protein [Photobacterium sp. GJ3]|uniref:transglutaminase-like domain-containing protein n=1 Tax=Photobacterium sp. GJ3 TaxID=2829502 RepID=UPI001B8D4F49|nr:transglutaminase-like domain-containing protein [Photobacterium sp. GJ3]QUJ68616.1 transglutaminase domain-containing protein [Photobacterium sp. GJ3]
MDAYLKETAYFDFHHPDIEAFNHKVTARSLKDKAIQIYYLVRDEIVYNPYTLQDGLPSLKASYCLQNYQAYCIPKASLMVALCRLNGIPARLGLADVINHLSTPALVEWLGTDYFALHGYAEIFLKGRWIKVTPVFHQALCDKFNVAALEFDGEHDAILHSATKDGSKHMEYVKYHGYFDDMPVEFIQETAVEVYPRFAAIFHIDDTAPLQ